MREPAHQRGARQRPPLLRRRRPDGQTGIAEQELLLAELNAALRAAFAHLPPKCHWLIALLIQDPPVPYAEIGAQLGIPAGSIGPYCSRCLQRLRDEEPLVIPSRRDVERSLAATGSVWRHWSESLRPGTEWRCRRAQRPGIEAPRPCPLGSDRCGGHDLAPRGGRRRAQLGLPLLLGAGRCRHAGHPAPPRPRRRGGCLFLVAHAGIPVDPPAPAGALPARRRSPGP
jgi:hypothetical protein